MSTTTTLEAVEVIKDRIDLLFITSAGVVIPSNLIANYGEKTKQTLLASNIS